MQLLIKKLEKENKLKVKASKYTQVSDEQGTIQGVLFFVPTDSRESKVFVPAPYHESLFTHGDPSYQQVLNHKEAMLLK